MSNLRHHPLGQPVPDSVHAVCVSLPTMDDVVGYEEKRADTLEAVKFAYPRFVFHDYILRTAVYVAAKHELTGRAAYALASVRSAEAMATWMELDEYGIVPEADFVLLHFNDTIEARTAAKNFLQHTGTSISSRHAEDYLLAETQLDNPQAEARFDGNAAAHVIGALQQYVETDALHLCTSGMNAIYAALKTTRQLQRQRGRTVYLQLGWLYLDTMKVLESFLGEDEEVVVLTDVYNWDAIEEVFENYGDRLAGVVTELPTNPLVQMLDIERLSALCVQHGAVRIFDPSLVGIVNVDILAYTDLLPTSLTKYAANAGDVMSGALAVNPDSPLYDELSSRITREIEPPYHRDVARLAQQIDDMPAVAALVNANAVALADYLNRSRKVERVYSPLQPRSADNFSKIARSEFSVGAIITIDLAVPLAEFYDEARIVKGPSFGTGFTMMCPFMYLAHYDLVNAEEGRAELARHGLNPELIRLSVGTEPINDIISALGL